MNKINTTGEKKEYMMGKIPICFHLAIFFTGNFAATDIRSTEMYRDVRTEMDRCSSSMKTRKITQTILSLLNDQ